MYQGGCNFHPIIFYASFRGGHPNDYFYDRKYEVPGQVWTTAYGHAWYWQLEPTVAQLQAPCSAKTPNARCYSRWDVNRPRPLHRMTHGAPDDRRERL